MLNRYPLIRILFPLIIGIILFYQFGNTFNPYIFGSISIFLFIISTVFWYKIKYTTKAYRGIVFAIGFLFLGISFSGFYNQKIFTLPDNCLKDTVLYIAQVNEQPTIKERSVKINCNITEYKTKQWKGVNNESCIIYLSKDINSLNLKYGDKILFNTILKTIPEPQNPNEFDYKKYLSLKGIRFQSYIDKNRWQKIDSNCGNWFIASAYQLREKFLNIFSSFNINQQDYGVVAAIILGYDEKLDPELSKQYSGAGVTHVLCVSGMHVGVIFMILNFFLGFMDKNRKTKIFKAILLLFFVWLYSAITGLSPSVQRSATMFTFVIIGNSLKQRVDTYNSLMGSLLFLIISNPFIIFNLGLQLSYFAVFGIVWLQKPIYNLWIPRFKAIDWTWQLMTVSIAAQIITTPISIFFFHQFPNYFLLSNLLVVFVSSLVIYAGVAVLATSFWFWLSNICAYILVFLVKLMNRITIFISDLPGSQTLNIDIDLFGTLILYIIIFSSIIFLYYRNKKMIWVSLSSIIIFLGYNLFDNYNELNSKKITLYSIRKQSIIDVKNENQLLVFTDSATFFANNQSNFQTNSHRISEGIVPQEIDWFGSEKTYRNNGIFKQGNYFQAGSKRIAIINQSFIPTYNRLKVDYAIINNNAKLRMKSIVKAIDAKLWIFDSSNSDYKINKWVKECDSLSVANYVVSKSGAYEIVF